MRGARASDVRTVGRQEIAYSPINLALAVRGAALVPSGSLIVDIGSVLRTMMIDTNVTVNAAVSLPVAVSSVTCVIDELEALPNATVVSLQLRDIAQNVRTPARPRRCRCVPRGAGVCCQWQFEVAGWGA